MFLNALVGLLLLQLDLDLLILLPEILRLDFHFLQLFLLLYGVGFHLFVHSINFRLEVNSLSFRRSTRQLPVGWTLDLELVKTTFDLLVLALQLLHFLFLLEPCVLRVL